MYRSRPTRSVPSGWPGLNNRWLASLVLTSPGFPVVRKSAKMAASTISTISTRPIIASRFRLNRRQTSPFGVAGATLWSAAGSDGGAADVFLGERSVRDADGHQDFSLPMRTLGSKKP